MPVLQSLILPGEIAAHGVGLAAARLSIREAGGHSPVKDRLDQGLGGEFVHHLVAAVVVEGVVESEILIFKVLGQVHFRFALVHDDGVAGGNADHVHLFLGLFCKKRFLLENQSINQSIDGR